MKAAPFDYVRADSADAAIAALTEHGEDAKLLAGGQSLLPMMALRLARPSVLIDIGRVDEWAGVSLEAGCLRIGATTTHTALGRDPLVKRHCPLLASIVPLIAHDAIRNRGTVGGSLAHADPAAELPAAALLLDGTLIAEGPAGRRSIPASEFFVSYLTTALEPDEVLVAVDVPAGDEASGASFREVSRRSGDFALCGAGASVTLDDRGRVGSTRVAFIGVDSTAVRTPAGERAMEGTDGGASAIGDAADAAVSELDPGDDLHASGAYRRHIARLLTRRVLTEAVATARRSP
jgi:aerobic carbon-monoxide dehydrogenase medium subunit